MIILIASQEHGMLIHDDGITEADLLYPRWLIPARDYRKPGDEYAAHINADGVPLCGVVFDEPYTATRFRCSYYPCPDCEEVAETGQLSLFGRAAV